MANRDRYEFTTLDAIRGVAALAVAFYHFAPFYSVNVGFSNGYLAVDLFFVLSGFIIAHSYDTRLMEGMSFGRFMALRFIRVTPMIAVGSLIGLAAAIACSQYSDSSFSLTATALLAIVNIPNVLIVAPSLFPLNAPQWTLAWELVVNAAFGLWLYRLRGRAVTMIAAGCGLLWMLSVFAHGSADQGYQWSQAGAGLCRVGAGFLLGVMLRRTFLRWQGRMLRLSAGRIALLTLLMLALPVPHFLQAFYDCLATLIGAPLIVMLGAVSEIATHRRAAGRALARLSYPLYAIHYPFTLVVASFIPSRFQALAAFALVCVLAVTSLVLARWFEEPIIAWLKRFTSFGRPRTRPIAP